MFHFLIRWVSFLIRWVCFLIRWVCFLIRWVYFHLKIMSALLYTSHHIQNHISIIGTSLLSIHNYLLPSPHYPLSPLSPSPRYLPPPAIPHYPPLPTIPLPPLSPHYPPPPLSPPPLTIPTSTTHTPSLITISIGQCKHTLLWCPLAWLHEGCMRLPSNHL